MLKKYLVSVLSLIFAAYIIFYVILLCMGKYFMYNNFLLHSAVAALAVVAVTVMVCVRGRAERKIERAASFLILPVTVIFCVVHAFVTCLEFNAKIATVFSAVLVICGGLMLIFSANGKLFKYIILGVMSAVTALCALLALLFCFFQMDMYDTVMSPQGEHGAKIGRQFGYPVVAVEDFSGRNLIFGRISNPPAVVFDVETVPNIEQYEVNVYWKNENILIVNDNEYSIKSIFGRRYPNLGVYIPNRNPEYSKNTHGGFFGDGTAFLIYELSEDEVLEIEEDIKTNGAWEKFNELEKWMEFGLEKDEIDILFSEKGGYYAFLDKQTGTREYNSGAGSYNYVCAVYSPEKKVLYVKEFDT